jgi:sodium/bile acid cotransporter 7
MKVATGHSHKKMWCVAAAVVVSIAIVSCGRRLPTPESGTTGDREKLEKINAMYFKYKEGFPNTPDISVDELLLLQKEEDVVLVDVREPEEQGVSMMPGAITVAEFERDPEGYRGKTIVAYCTIGSRSGYFTRELRERGFRAFNLRGSILSWAHAGKEFVDRDGRATKRAHVYSGEWNLLPKGYEAVW